MEEDKNHFNKLPEECVCEILFLTSPQEACRASLVFSSFKSAMESDIIWQKFLPSDYLHILSRSSSSSHHLLLFSKKQLFHQLCNPLLIDNGLLSFILEKSSGKKSYLISSRGLKIAWSKHPLYWFWIPMTNSRFSEVALLRTTHWLEIQGKIETKTLSPNTMYGAYLVMKLRHNAYGFDSHKVELSIKVGDRFDIKNTTLLMEKDNEREDGWMEIKIGEFYVNGDCSYGNEEITMSFMEVKSCHLKGGLIVEGIEVRPILSH